MAMANLTISYKKHFSEKWYYSCESKYGDRNGETTENSRTEPGIASWKQNIFGLPCRAGHLTALKICKMSVLMDTGWPSVPNRWPW